MKLSDAIQHAVKEWKGTRSEKQYVSACLGLLGDCGDVELDSIDFHNLAKGRWSKYQPATIKRKIAILSKVMAVAKDNGWKGDKPSKPKILLATGKSESLEPSQVSSLLAATSDEVLSTLIETLYYTGLRPNSEALNIQRKHIRKTLKGWVLDVPQAKTKPRQVPLCDKLIDSWRKFGVFELDPSAPLFKYRGYGFRNISKKWDRLTERVLGVSGGDYSIYILRHSFCTNMLEAGVSLEVIKELAGHSNIATTSRYLHPSAKKKSDAVNVL